MTSRSPASARLIVLVVTVAGCGSTKALGPAPSETHTSSAVTSVSEPATSAAKPARELREPPAVHVARTRYGTALVDRRGFALYLFTRDAGRASACYGACATRWPPYLLRKPPVGGESSRLLGAVRRNEGKLQATYAGHPLYHYIGDRAPGQVLCQAAPEFGGIWYVVAKDGRAIR
jgi:predicted lipoprotein with Yx(FWY)xxD motif